MVALGLSDSPIFRNNDPYDSDIGMQSQSIEDTTYQGSEVRPEFPTSRESAKNFLGTISGENRDLTELAAGAEDAYTVSRDRNVKKEWSRQNYSPTELSKEPVSTPAPVKAIPAERVPQHVYTLSAEDTPAAHAVNDINRMVNLQVHANQIFAQAESARAIAISDSIDRALDAEIVRLEAARKAREAPADNGLLAGLNAEKTSGMSGYYIPPVNIPVQPPNVTLGVVGKSTQDAETTAAMERVFNRQRHRPPLEGRLSNNLTPKGSEVHRTPELVQGDFADTVKYVGKNTNASRYFSGPRVTPDLAELVNAYVKASSGVDVSKIYSAAPRDAVPPAPVDTGRVNVPRIEIPGDGDDVVRVVHSDTVDVPVVGGRMGISYYDTIPVLADFASAPEKPADRKGYTPGEFSKQSRASGLQANKQGSTFQEKPAAPAHMSSEHAEAVLGRTNAHAAQADTLGRYVEKVFAKGDVAERIWPGEWDSDKIVYQRGNRIIPGNKMTDSDYRSIQPGEKTWKVTEGMPNGDAPYHAAIDKGPVLFSAYDMSGWKGPADLAGSLSSAKSDSTWYFLTTLNGRGPMTVKRGSEMTADDFANIRAGSSIARRPASSDTLGFVNAGLDSLISGAKYEDPTFIIYHLDTADGVKTLAFDAANAPKHFPYPDNAVVIKYSPSTSRN
jgi:hypothetical protein